MMGIHEDAYEFKAGDDVSDSLDLLDEPFQTLPRYDAEGDWKMNSTTEEEGASAWLHGNVRSACMVSRSYLLSISSLTSRKSSNMSGSE